jgi:SAM-dependent methyltransferase
VRRGLQCGTEFAGPTWRCPSCSFVPQTAGSMRFAGPSSGRDNVDARAFARLAEADSDSFWFRGRASLIGWALERHSPKVRDFLEIGCGAGYVLEQSTGARTDLSLSVAELLQEGGLLRGERRARGATFYQLDSRALPFAGASNVVGVFDSLEHIEADKAALADSRKAVRDREQPGCGGADHPIQSPSSAARRVAGGLERILAMERSIIARGLDFPAVRSLVLVATTS